MPSTFDLTLVNRCSPSDGHDPGRCSPREHPNKQISNKKRAERRMTLAVILLSLSDVRLAKQDEHRSHRSAMSHR
jgi:hypothetical protein